MYDDDEEQGLPSTYEIYFSEALALFNKREYGKAIEFFTNALELRLDDPAALVARSKCYLRRGDPENALKDAETSLAEDNTFHRGILAKAEALYYVGDFEMALVFYHRGHKLRPEVNDFFLGIQKAQEAIDNAVGTPDKVQLTTKGDLTFMAKQSDKKMATKAKNISVLKRLEEKPKPKPMVITSKRHEFTIKQLLGRLYGDREYLDSLLKETRRVDHKSDTGKKVVELCEEGIVYLDTRGDFWRQHKPIYSRKHEQLQMLGGHILVDARQETCPNEYLVGELDKIDRAQAANRYEDSLTRAKRVLKTIEKYDESIVPNLNELLANLHSLMGNAYLDMAQFTQALYHHRVDNEIGTKYDMADSISRSLDNIGRVFARTGRFQQAIDTWMQKLPLCKSNLEKTWLYHEIGRCHLELENYIEAQQYGDLSLSSANDADDFEWKLQATVLIAQAEVKLIDHRAALVTFGKALEIAILLGDESAEDAISRAIDEVNNKIVEGLQKQSDDQGIILPGNNENTDYLEFVAQIEEDGSVSQRSDRSRSLRSDRSKRSDKSVTSRDKSIKSDVTNKSDDKTAVTEKTEKSRKSIAQRSETQKSGKSGPTTSRQVSIAEPELTDPGDLTDIGDDMEEDDLNSTSNDELDDGGDDGAKSVKTNPAESDVEKTDNKGDDADSEGSRLSTQSKKSVKIVDE